MAEYIPITELPHASETAISLVIDDDGPEFRLETPSELTWEFNLPPYINAERIELNMSRVRGIHRIGAFAASQVVEYQGKTTKEEPSIVGMNANGTAVAGKTASVEKGELENSSTLLLGDYPFMGESTQGNYGKALALHQLNGSEIQQNVQNRRPTNKTRDGIWAEELSRALGASYRSASKEHLTRGSLAMRVYSYAYAGWIAGLTGYGIFEHGSTTAPTTAVAVLGLVAAIDSAGMCIRHGESRILDRRLSLLLNGTQLDRHLAVSAMTRVPGLLRVNPET